MERSTSAPNTARSAVSLPPLGKSADVSGTNLCRAEREFFTIVRRGQWNDLGPHCRLSLLRDCATSHIEWPHFTPHCQLWVLRELARVCSEGVNEAKSIARISIDGVIEGDAEKKVAPLRLKSLVKADANASSELSDLCDRCLNLPRVADSLRRELRAHEQSVLRANSVSPTSTMGSRSGGRSPLYARFQKSGPMVFDVSKMEKAAKAKEQEQSTRRRGRGKQEEHSIGLKGSASAPDLRRRNEKLAPMADTIRPMRLDRTGTMRLDGESGEQSDDKVKENGPQTSATRLAAMAWDETRSIAFFKNRGETIKIGSREAAEDGSVNERGPVMNITTFNLLASHSTEGKAAEEQAKRFAAEGGQAAKDRLAKEEADRLAAEEADRLAKEEAKRLAAEEARRAQEAEEAKRREEEEALLAKQQEEEALLAEAKEAKRKKAAENEAKKAAKEAEIACKAAEREAEKQREAELHAKAKSTVEEFLASKGLDSIHAIHECGRPALLLAAAEGTSFLLECILVQGADIRAADHADGAGALHLAAGAGKPDNIEVLMRYGMSVEAQDAHGERPLHFAAGSGSIETLEYLKNIGAKTSAKSMAGRSPIFSAAAKDVVESAEWLIENGAVIDVKDDNGTTLLHVAAFSNSPKMVTWLLNKGADATVKDHEGNTAKAIAKKNKCKKALKAFGE